MQTLHEILSAQIKQLIAEYNTHSKLSTFFYHNPDCKRLALGEDSKYSEYRSHQIETELTPIVNEHLDGKRVRVQCSKFHGGKIIDGVIHHSLTREVQYNGVGEMHTIQKEVSFRGLNDGNALDEQTIALWVETGDKYTTHLYTADRIELVDSTDVNPLYVMSKEEEDAIDNGAAAAEQERDEAKWAIEEFRLTGRHRTSKSGSIDRQLISQQENEEEHDSPETDICGIRYDLNGNER